VLSANSGQASGADARNGTLELSLVDKNRSVLTLPLRSMLLLRPCSCSQDAFMENYFESQRDQIFRGVEVLIYVFDIESQDRKKDMDNFASCLDAIKQGSKNAHIFALIHKMDLIHKDEERAALFEERAAELRKMADPLRITCFGTSIWDETLYKAWSSIVYALVPNVDILESNLDKLCRLCEADEIVMFEKATFLVISHATHRAHEDVHRYEKASPHARTRARW